MFQILSQRFHEKMAKFDVSSDKDSWGHALVRIKKFCEEEIRTIYSDVFGIDRKFPIMIGYNLFLHIIE